MSFQVRFSPAVAAFQTNINVRSRIAWRAGKTSVINADVNPIFSPEAGLHPEWRASDQYRHFPKNFAVAGGTPSKNLAKRYTATVALQSKKPFVGPLKPDKPFLLLRPASHAELAFYEGYDPDFIAKKAAVLFAAYKNSETFADFAKSIGWPLDSNDASFLGALATELHCATFHQYEGMLALLLAEYQDRPDWVYLSSYGTKEIKAAARAIADGRFEEITHGSNHTAEEFVATAVYATWRPSETAASYDSWKESLKSIAWFIANCAERYLKGTEYNAYKHGLRVVSGAAGLAVGSAPGSADFKTILAMRHSLSYLELEDTPEGYVAQEITLELSPEYSYEQIRIASGVLATVREMRIARLQGKADALNLFLIDQHKLASLKPVSSMSFSY